MDTPIFRLYLVKPSLEAVMLPEERITEFFQKNAQHRKELGIRSLISGTIWSNERHTFFGIQWFPSWKEVREHTRFLDELHWFQYADGENYLGVEDPDSPISLEPLNLDPNIDWIANIFVARALPAMYDAAEADLTADYTKAMESSKALGVRSVMIPYAKPANEEYNWWGIEFLPSMDALVKKVRYQEELKWWKYMFARTFLGTADDGDMIKS